jgi:hypothetical protein
MHDAYDGLGVAGETEEGLSVLCRQQHPQGQMTNGNLRALAGSSSYVGKNVLGVAVLGAAVRGTGVL